jgi:cytochrome c-type biogenesis protein CcmH
MDSGFRQNDAELCFASRVSRLTFLLLLFISIPSFAVIEDREFTNPVEAQRYQNLIEELRCPKCQNQNIADSDAEIAEDLRNEIYRQLRDGKSDKEIVDYLVARYGEFVNYRPPLNSKTVLLWSAPGVLLFIGVLIWWRRFAVKKIPVDSELSAQEQQRLRDLLKANHSSGDQS